MQDKLFFKLYSALVQPDHTYSKLIESIIRTKYTLHTVNYSREEEIYICCLHCSVTRAIPSYPPSIHMPFLTETLFANINLQIALGLPVSGLQDFKE